MYKITSDTHIHMLNLNGFPLVIRVENAFLVPFVLQSIKFFKPSSKQLCPLLERFPDISVVLLI